MNKHHDKKDEHAKRLELPGAFLWGFYWRGDDRQTTAP